MTEAIIYRLNRVPEKLHVALLELLGIQTRPPSAATTDLRFRLAAPPAEPVLIPAGDDRGRNGPDGDRRVDRLPDVLGLRDPGRAAAAYAVKRGGRVKNVGVGAGTSKPEGADQFPFGIARQGRRRPLPGLRRVRSRACSCRSRSTARRPAARASIPRTRRFAGRSRARPSPTAGSRPRCSRIRRAASTTAAARYSCSFRTRTPRPPSRASESTASAAASTAQRGRDDRRRASRSRRDLRDHGRADRGARRR